MRKFFITDLHGCYEGLVQCLDRCGFDKEKDMLISGGDICDGYSDVCEIVELFLSIKNAVFITGNHDQWFIEWLEGGVHPDRWRSGGEGTLKSYIRNTMGEFGSIQHLGYDETGKSWGFSTNLFADKFIKELKSHADFFLKKQRRYYIDEDGNLFIHGGFNRHFNLEDQNSYTFMWDRDLWNSALSYQELMNQGDDGYEFKIHQKFKDIFIGHTTTHRRLIQRANGSDIVQWAFSSTGAQLGRRRTRPIRSRNDERMNLGITFSPSGTEGD